jgi:hypothetical protein
MVSATALLDVSEFVSIANRRHQLRALFVRDDMDARWLPQLFERAGLRTLRNTLVHSDLTVPRRVLTAWWHGAQSELIAEGNMADDRLFVISCALERYEIPFDKMVATFIGPGATFTLIWTAFVPPSTENRYPIGRQRLSSLVVLHDRVVSPLSPRPPRSRCVPSRALYSREVIACVRSPRSQTSPVAARDWPGESRSHLKHYTNLPPCILHAGIC